MNNGLASWSLPSSEFWPCKIFCMWENTFFNKCKAGHVVLVSRVLDFENIPEDNVFVIEINWFSISLWNLRKIIQVCIAHDDNIFLQFSKNSIVKVWVILLLVKSLDFLPHFLVFFVLFLIVLLLSHLPSLFFHVFERSADRCLTTFIEGSYCRSLINFGWIKIDHLVRRCNLFCNFPSQNLRGIFLTSWVVTALLEWLPLFE